MFCTILQIRHIFLSVAHNASVFSLQSDSVCLPQNANFKKLTVEARRSLSLSAFITPFTAIDDQRAVTKTINNLEKIWPATNTARSIRRPTALYVCKYSQ